jgi:hypothetical protein
MCNMLFMILLSVKSFSQPVTTVINYSYSTLNSNCNVFASPVVEDGFVHQTNFGFPFLTDNSIALQNAPINFTSFKGTGYRIPFNFKIGYSYQISVNGKSTTKPGLLQPSIALSISTTDGGTNSSTTCTGPETLSTAILFNYVQGAFGSTYAWINNLISTNPLTQNYGYLLVAGVPSTTNNTSAFGTTYIRVIQIVEIPPPCTLQPPPTGLTATTTNNSAIVSWNQSQGAESYIAEYKEVNSQTWIDLPNQTFNPLSNTRYPENLQNGTTYDWRVKATCSAGSGNWAQSQFTTSTCNTPTNLVASNITPNSADVSWSPVSGATSYNITCKKAITHDIIFQNVNTTTTTYSITGLEQFTMYDFEVNTICPSGVSSLAWFSFTTSGTCPNVSNLNTSSITCNSVILSWTHPPSPAFGFAYIDYKESSSGTWIAAPGFPIYTPYTLTGLSANTTYDWRVRSQCWGQAGNYLQSQFTTAPGACRISPSTKSYNSNDVNISDKQYENRSKVTEVEEGTKFSVFPTPAGNTINVLLNTQNKEKIKIEIINVAGNTIFSNIVLPGTKTLQINVRSYINGLYLLKVSAGNYNKIEKIIIQH